ncbi:copper resistance protein NlpE [Marinobacter sp. BGYM27]|uniref:copper resistance protein NlpE n=1 Tax=Marinobacter sp. BGYM27 TaxID=2975597 RepID=UPI0021A8C839|nr:copper resistance protein NlpE [Marinobacter sp. BGYM27]MDG5501510.1 copper resistance protein NlpE [Marinobacter sp. BGYM27]
MSGYRLATTLMMTLLISACATVEPEPAPKQYGTWSGTLPCADCAGIETRLTLFAQPRTYVLEEAYKGKPEPIEHSGTWSLLPPENAMDLGRIVLTNEKGTVDRQFRRLPDGGLKMLGKDGKDIRSELNYTLERKRISD